MNEPIKDHPDVAARPPRVFVFTAAMGILLDQVWLLHLVPLYSALAVPIKLFGAITFLVGLVVVRSTMRELKRHKTNIATWKASRTIVSSGIFKYSRNPIYAGMFAMLLGVALILNNLWLILCLIPLVIFMHYGVIRKEEIYLERQFGELYRQYKNDVGYWINVRGF